MTTETLQSPVLAAIDFSDFSEKTLLKALQLARCLSAPVVALHVVHDPAQMPGYYSRYTKKKHLLRIEDMAKEMLEDFISSVSENHPKIDLNTDFETMLVTGLPVTRILQVIEKISPAMVVLGSKGATGLKHLMIGSVAEQVVRLSPVDVTIVK